MHTYEREQAREGMVGRDVVNSATHVYAYTCAYIRESVRMRVRERASKGGQDTEGGRDLGEVGETEGGLERGGERALRKKNTQLNTPSVIHC